MGHNFSFELSTIGMVESLALMMQGKLDPKVWSENEHMDREGRVEHYKAQVLGRVQTQYRYARDTISKYRNASADELRAAQRQYEKSLERIPADLTEPVFDMCRTFLTDAIEEMSFQISEKEPPREKNVRDEIREIIEAINDLQRDRLEEMEKHPDQADLINRIYRQAIDRLRERV